MRRCIFSFFCVFLALASCSPRVYSGEQDVRAFESTSKSDSVRFMRLVDARMEAYLAQHMERAAELQQEIVRESFSNPDSTGRQHITERSTMRSIARSHTSAGSVAAQGSRMSSETDSIAVRDTAVLSEMEERIEETLGDGRPARRMPWYVFLASLAGAVIVGFILGLRGGKWISCKL